MTRKLDTSRKVLNQDRSHWSWDVVPLQQPFHWKPDDLYKSALRVSNFRSLTRYGWWLFLPPATKLGQGYVFTGVCDSVHGGGVSASVHAGIHPSGADTPWEQTPREQTPPRSRHPTPRADTPLPEQTPPWTRHPPEQTPPGPDTPRSRHPLYQTPSPGADTPPNQTPPRADTPPGGCWEIRSMRGRYASYWNAILFLLHKRLLE